MLASVAPGAIAQSSTVRLHAAGSLRAAFEELSREFRQREAIEVQGAYGPSGLLRDRIAGGEPAEVFASANVQHPASLASAGRAADPIVFARNALCALTRADVGLTTENLLDRMLDPGVKLGTSTPRADPSGDYAWQLFARSESLRPGARAALEAKALQLTGGPNSPPPPKDRNVYGDLVARRQADVFLTYCTNAVLAKRDFPELASVSLPAALSVEADYGLTVMKAASAPAWRFAWFVLSEPGQAVLARYGFSVRR